MRPLVLPSCQPMCRYLLRLLYLFGQFQTPRGPSFGPSALPPGNLEEGRSGRSIHQEPLAAWRFAYRVHSCTFIDRLRGSYIWQCDVEVSVGDIKWQASKCQPIKGPNDVFCAPKPSRHSSPDSGAYLTIGLEVFTDNMHRAAMCGVFLRWVGALALTAMSCRYMAFSASLAFNQLGPDQR